MGSYLLNTGEEGSQTTHEYFLSNLLDNFKKRMFKMVSSTYKIIFICKSVHYFTYFAFYQFLLLFQ